MLVNGLNQTVATMTLPTPIAAGASATIEADWNFRVPLVAGARGLRMGSWGDSLFQVAQWYPRLAMYDDLRGWDTDPYLGPSEFYNNFGHFDVTIDVPAGWGGRRDRTAADPRSRSCTPSRPRTGSPRARSNSTRIIVGPADFGAGKATVAGDRLSWHFVADTVGDFAWGTSKPVSSGTRTQRDDSGKGPIPVYGMYLPGHATAYARGGAVNRHALEFYSKLWMPYAFPILTMLDGPDGGMEYPMTIFSGVGAADHETGHQWWPMMVGVNETS